MLPPRNQKQLQDFIGKGKFLQMNMDQAFSNAQSFSKTNWKRSLGFMGRDSEEGFQEYEIQDGSGHPAQISKFQQDIQCLY